MGREQIIKLKRRKTKGEKQITFGRYNELLNFRLNLYGQIFKIEWNDKLVKYHCDKLENITVASS